jgi:predicted nucleic acid-binding protein
MILVDSSVWIDFFRGNDNAAVEQLASLLEEGSAPLGMADLVLFEVLRNFRHEKDFIAAQRTLRALPVVDIGGEDTALAAARHYRTLKSYGHTIASPIDVLLASYCIENDYALLHSDSDFDAMETLRGLKVWRH